MKFHSSSFETDVCGNWIAIQNEKCYKLLDPKNRKTFEEAKTICSQQKGNNPELLKIINLEEQQFIENWLFNISYVVNDVWLNVKLDQYPVASNQTIMYNNWHSKTINQTENGCVEIISVGKDKGKWISAKCNKKNIVVCQTSQYNFQKIQNDFFELKNSFQIENKELRQNYSALKNDFELSTEKSRQNIDALKRDLKLITEESKKNYGAIKNYVKLISQESRLNHSKLINNFNVMTEGLRQNQSKLENELIPIGFLYIQYPFESEPHLLWSKYIWTEVTSKYNNSFFRAEGSNTASFGYVQEGSAPRLTSLQSTGFGEGKKETISVYPGSWSDGICTGKYDKDDDGWCYLTNFMVSKEEVKPQNMAIKIWKRKR